MGSVLLQLYSEETKQQEYHVHFDVSFIESDYYFNKKLVIKRWSQVLTTTNK
jgi:hypothetical protein